MKRAIAVAALAAASSPTAAHAHQATTRQLIVQLDERGLVALFRVTVMGPGARLTVAVWDHNRDGLLETAERAGAALSILARTLPDVALSWDGEPLRPHDLVPRFTGAGERAAAAEGLLSFEVPPTGTGCHTLRIGLSERADSLAVQLQTLGSWRLSVRGVESAADKRGLAAPLVLAPGREVEVKVVPVKQRTP